MRALGFIQSNLKSFIEEIGIKPYHIALRSMCCLALQIFCQIHCLMLYDLEVENENGAKENANKTMPFIIPSRERKAKGNFYELVILKLKLQ